MAPRITVTPGERYAMLLVQEFPVSAPKGRWCARVLCDCGRQGVFKACDLVAGRIKSCGCRARVGLEANRLRHGHAGTREYMIWAMAKDRCINPRNRSYLKYGGRGIRFDSRWASDFAAFYSDMGMRPGPGHTLERLDVNGNYEPGNCVWATYAQQNRNTRRNIHILRKGKRYVLKDLALAVGLKPNTVVCRRLKYRWPEHRWFEPYTVDQAIEAFEARAQPT